MRKEERESETDGQCCSIGKLCPGPAIPHPLSRKVETSLQAFPPPAAYPRVTRHNELIILLFVLIELCHTGDTTDKSEISYSQSRVNLNSRGVYSFI